MSQHSLPCPMCEKGRLVEHAHDRRKGVDGFAFDVYGLAHSICDYCGEYIVTSDQSRQNKRIVIAARMALGAPVLSEKLDNQPGPRRA